MHCLQEKRSIETENSQEMKVWISIDMSITSSNVECLLLGLRRSDRDQRTPKTVTNFRRYEIFGGETLGGGFGGW